MQYFVDSREYGRNVYSQYGEDGVIERILNDLNIDISTAMEFGAWDGMHLSNTFALADKLKKLILVEGDEKKFSDLLATSEKYKSIVPVNAYVVQSGKNSVDGICQSNGIDHLDLLSIDIDGYENLILRGLKIRPTLIVVEFNPTFGALTSYENDETSNVGNSFFSIYEIMARKNYSLVGRTKTNLFFLSDNILVDLGYEKFRLSNIEILRDIDQHQFRVSSGYDGQRLQFGREFNPWDGSRIAKVYTFPSWVYGWEPSYWQLAYRALRTLSFGEIISGIRRAREKGWF